MEEFPSNSRNPQRPPAKAKDEDKHLEPITVNTVSRRKKPLGRRFTETFVQADIGSVWRYVWFDVLVPAAKDMLVDAGSEALQRSFYGESARGGRRHRPPAGPGSYTNYSRYASSGPLDPKNEPRRMTRRGRQTHNFDELILGTRAEAEEVLDRLYDIVAKYEQASVKDLYDLTNQEVAYTDHKWGWTDLRGAGIQRLPSGGYLLDLPRPEPLD